MKATINQMAAYGIRETAAYTSNQNAGVQHPVDRRRLRLVVALRPPGG